MIATALVFALGALISALVALLLVPLVWRKAQKLARRDFEATMPASMNEIRAEVDRVRAEAAMTIRHSEILSGRAHEAARLAKAESGRLSVLNLELASQRDHFEALAKSSAEELGVLSGHLRHQEELYRRIEADHQGARQNLEFRDGELQSLSGRIGELDALADERRVRLAAAETKVEEMQSELRAARQELERLRGGALTEDATVEIPEPEELENQAPERDEAAASSLPADTGLREAAKRLLAEIPLDEEDASLDSAERERQDAQIRDRIADITAQLIHLKTASASETEISPPRPLTIDGDGDAPAIDGAPASSNVAERVRLLQGTSAAGAAGETAILSEVSGTPPTDVSGPAPQPARPKRRRGGGRGRPPSTR